MATGKKNNPDSLAGVVHQNIDTIVRIRQEYERSKNIQDRVASKITGFTGSIKFVFFHAILVGIWIVINSGKISSIKPFDPFPFAILAMCASVEALFLSTFVLMNQNRMSMLSERRADLDLQINLLSEHEVTRLIHLVDAIANHLGVTSQAKPNLEELKKDVTPEVVMKTIEEAEKKVAKQ